MDNETPDYLIPTMGQLPVSSSRFYKTATITHVEDTGQDGMVDQGQFSSFSSTLNEITDALEIPADTVVMNGAPAQGVMLTHQQSWIIQGLSLGPLLHSVCLAPGEITQIAVENNSRSVHESSVDQGLQSEKLSEQKESMSDLDEEELSSVSEKTSGSSTTSSSSSNEQGGFSAAPLGIGTSGGIGMTQASSKQANRSTGHRSVSDMNNQSLHQQARDQANSAREQHTSSVREVSEKERTEMQTRVVVNYNHMHALTMQYYEVEQVYRLSTKVTKAERLLFIPVQPIDFTEASAIDLVKKKFRKEFMDIAADLGLHHIAAKLLVDSPKDLLKLTQKGNSTDIKLPFKAFKKLISKVGIAKASWSVARRYTQPVLDVFLEQASVLQNEKELLVRAGKYAVLKARDGLRELEKKKDPGLVEKAQWKDKLNTANLQKRIDDRELSDIQDVISLLNNARSIITSANAQADDAENLGDEEMMAIMDEHKLEFNQGLWLRISSADYLRMFRGYTHAGNIPGEKGELVHQRLDHHVDPTPVAVSGNYIGFRWNFMDEEQRQRFEKKYKDVQDLQDSVTLPTGGVFGEAVLGVSNGAEKIDLSRFWNWKDSLPPIRPTEIEAIGQHEHAPLRAPSRAEIQQQHLDLGAIQFPEVTSGIASLGAVLGNKELFKDMSGKETTSALAEMALDSSAKVSSKAREIASENYQRHLDLQAKLGDMMLQMHEDQNNDDATIAGGKLNSAQEALRKEGGLEYPTEPLLKPGEHVESSMDMDVELPDTGIVDTY